MEVARLPAKHLSVASPASEVWTTPCLQPPRKLRKRVGSVGSALVIFTIDDLQRCLYNQGNIRLLKNEDVKKPQSNESQNGDQCFWCDISRTENVACPLHKNASPNGPKIVEAPNSIKTLPDEVQLCLSGIPGSGYGVCAKRLIPVGAWIGPYEGKFIQVAEITHQTDTSYMWEIYDDGKLCAFIDGNDENSSSWMRYIRCARHKQEQNMYAFQYMGKIYYRAFRDIHPGTEMLVWYDEKYPQYLGIPSNVFDMAAFIPNGAGVPPGNAAVLPQGRHPPARQLPPSPSTPTLPPTPPGVTPRTPTFKKMISLPGNHSNAPQSQHLALTSPTRALPASAITFPQGDAIPRQISDKQLANGIPVGTPVAMENATSRLSQHTLEKTDQAGTNGMPESPVKRDPTPPVSSGKSESESDSEPASPGNRFPDVSEVSLWKCGQCKKSFPQRAMLQVHVCMEYPRKPFQCGHCSEFFSLPNELRTHAVIHVGKKPFRCGYCSRSFAGATTLNNHIRTHTGERPFFCERCGKHFTQGSQLSRHQRIPGDCVARA